MKEISTSQTLWRSAICAVLIAAGSACSPLAQSIPKNRSNSSGGGEELLSLPDARTEPAPSSPQERQNTALLAETHWVDVSRYRPSALSQRVRAVELDLTSAQLDELILSRRVQVFRLPHPGRNPTAAQALALLDLSTTQIERAHIPDVTLQLEPSEEDRTLWVLRVSGGTETAILAAFEKLERLRLSVAGIRRSDLDLNVGPTLSEFERLSN